MKNVRNHIVAVCLTIMAAALLVESGDAAPNSPAGPDVRVVNAENNPVPVAVLNFPTGTNTVQVSSSTNAPLLVREVDKPARIPFVTNVFVTLTDGELGGGAVVLSNAPNQRLVIEAVTVVALLQSGEIAETTVINDFFGSGRTTHHLTVTPCQVVADAVNFTDFYCATHSIRLNCGPGVVVADLHRSPSNGRALGKFSISGYFENAP